MKCEKNEERREGKLKKEENRCFRLMIFPDCVSMAAREEKKNRGG